MCGWRIRISSQQNQVGQNVLNQVEFVRQVAARRQVAQCCCLLLRPDQDVGIVKAAVAHPHLLRTNLVRADRASNSLVAP
jgi:hypothetical protein